MKRILLMVFRNFFRVPFYWFKLCYMAAHVEKYTEQERYEFLKKIVGFANTGGNVTIEPHGIENIPQKDGFVFYPNHQGLYDMLAIVDVCPRPCSGVIKKEAADIPFIKQVISCLRALVIDREDVRQSMQVIMDVTKEVQKGRSYVIFAEGTRSKQGNKVQDFKGGSFKAATKAKCPIVPIALIDSFKPFDTSDISPVTVQVHFLKPMLYEEYKEMKTTEIAAEVKRRIEAVIEQYAVPATVQRIENNHMRRFYQF